MRIHVFDIGNSFLKSEVWQVAENGNTKLCRSHHTPASRHMSENLQTIQHAVDSHEQDAIIFLSMSDNVVWENARGDIIWIPAQEPTHNYARLDKRPPYRETGKSVSMDWQGIYNKLMFIEQQCHFGAGFKNMRILPFSGMCAAWLCGDKSFNNWDITHASNSGVFSYQLPSADERFPNSGWHPCISAFIDRNWISEKILPSCHSLTMKDGTPVLIGGHDTTFANAMHPAAYGSRPYISAGTWVTVSVESSVRPNWEDTEGARYVIAPNGAILKQLCFPSPTTDKRFSEAVAKIVDYLHRHLPEKTDVPISIFGGWRQKMYDAIAPLLLPNHKPRLEHAHYLTEQAAVFTARSFND